MSSEKGAYLPLTAFLAIAFLALIGLMIDTNVWSSTKTRVEHLTDHAALVALERFFETSSDHGTDVGKRLEEAALRASDIAGFNISAKGFIIDSAATLDDIRETSGGHNGQLFPGIWHFEAPTKFGSTTCEYKFPPGSDPTQSCPCGPDTDSDGISGADDGMGGVTGTAWNGPCFEELPTPSAGAPINAIRLEYTTGSSGKATASTFLKAFANLVGATSPEHEMKSQSYAAVKPRRTVFLLDLSHSMTGDTHNNALQKPSNRPQIWGGYTAEISDSGSCPTATSYDDWSDPVCDGTCSVGSGALANNLDRSEALIFRCIPPSGTSYPGGHACVTPPFASLFYPSLSPIPNHRRSSFACQSVATGDSLRPNQTFLIDEVTRPEPLSSALDGINGALRALQDRGVSADRAAIVGFDTQVLAPRSTTTGGLPDPAYVDLKDSEISSFLTATDTSSITNKYSRFLFPRFKTTRNGTTDVVQANAAATDIFLAFEKAAELIQNDPMSTSAENSIILFSDGVTICTSAATAAAESLSNECYNDLEHFMFAMQDAFDRMGDLIAERDVHVHVFLAGDSVRPHSLLRKNNAGDGCMDDFEARTLGFNMADGSRTLSSGTVFDASVAPDLTLTWTTLNAADTLDAEDKFNRQWSQFPWTPANTWYQVARATDGLWVPLRPACPSPVAFQATMKAKCADGALVTGDVISGARRGGASSTLRQPVLDSFGNQIYIEAVDGLGRLTCDPEGRTKSQQVYDAIDKLMERNPYILVQP